MAKQRVQIGDPEQGVCEAAVPHIDPRRLHESLLHIRVAGREAADQEYSGQQIQVTDDRGSADSQPAGESRGVQQPTLAVGEHRPESFEGEWRDARVELRRVTLKIGADQIPAIDQAVFFAIREEAEREAAANPQPGRGLERGFHFEDVEGAEVHILDPAREALRLLEERNRSRPENQETTHTLAQATSLIDQNAEFGEDLGHLVDLIEDDQSVLIGADEERHVGELIPIRRALEIQDYRVGLLGNRAGERGLAGLARTEERNDRLSAEGGADLFGGLTGNHSCKS